MIRILVDGCIFSAYPHGGIARIYREIFPRIVRSNEDIEFKILGDGKALQCLPAHPRIQPLAFKRLNLRPYRLFRGLDSWRMGKFNQSIADFAPDIFQSTFYTLPPFGGVKTVAMVYDLIDHQFPLMQPNGAGFVARQGEVLKAADRVVSISRSTTDLAVNAFGLDPAKIQTVGLGASNTFAPATDDAKRSFKEQYTGGRPYFLFVGAVGAYKNVATLVRAFAEVADQTGHVLLLAGHSMGSLEPWLIDLAIQYKVEDKILLLHRPTDEVLSIAYSASTAFVFPSLQEGFGIPLLEAMNCDCMVIASKISVFREICESAAIYFEPHNASELALCMLQVVAGVDEVEARCARQRQLRLFSWDDAAHRIQAIYRALAQTQSKDI